MLRNWLSHSTASGGEEEAQGNPSRIRKSGLSIYPQSQGRAEGLKVELVSNGQCFYHLYLWNEASKRTQRADFGKHLASWRHGWGVEPRRDTEAPHPFFSTSTHASLLPAICAYAWQDPLYYTRKHAKHLPDPMSRSRKFLQLPGAALNSWLVRTISKTTWSLRLALERRAAVALSPQAAGSDTTSGWTALTLNWVGGHAAAALLGLWEETPTH